MPSQDASTPSLEWVLTRRSRRAAGLNRPCLAASLTLHLAVLGGILFGPGLFAERTYLERHTVELVRLPTIRPKPIPATPPPEEESPPPAPAPEPEPEPLPEEPPEDVPVLVEEEAAEPEPPAPPPPAPDREPEPEPEPRPALERPFQRTHTVDDSLTGKDDAEAPVVGYDSEDFTYAYYTTRLVAAIRARWIRPPIEGVEAVVRFRIASDGAVSALELIESSGVTRFDNAGLRAIEAASPVPPLPRSFRKPSLGVTMRIR